jgi:hypothetical protein
VSLCHGSLLFSTAAAQFESMSALCFIDGLISSPIDLRFLGGIIFVAVRILFEMDSVQELEVLKHHTSLWIVTLEHCSFPHHTIRISFDGEYNFVSEYNLASSSPSSLTTDVFVYVTS